MVSCAVLTVNDPKRRNLSAVKTVFKELVKSSFDISESIFVSFASVF
jgi:hypothetical protein